MGRLPTSKPERIPSGVRNPRRKSQPPLRPYSSRARKTWSGLLRRPLSSPLRKKLDPDFMRAVVEPLVEEAKENATAGRSKGGKTAGRGRKKTGDSSEKKVSQSKRAPQARAKLAKMHGTNATTGNRPQLPLWPARRCRFASWGVRQRGRANSRLRGVRSTWASVGPGTLACRWLLELQPNKPPNKRNHKSHNQKNPFLCAHGLIASRPIAHLILQPRRIVDGTVERQQIRPAASIATALQLAGHVAGSVGGCWSRVSS